MANLNVSYSEIQAAAQRLTSGQGELESQLVALQNFIQSLIQNGFVTDHASVAFGETYNNFNQAANQVISNLSLLAQNLNTTAQVLQETDAQLASGLRS